MIQFIYRRGAEGAEEREEIPISCLLSSAQLCVLCDSAVKHLPFVGTA